LGHTLTQQPNRLAHLFGWQDVSHDKPARLWNAGLEHKKFCSAGKEIPEVQLIETVLYGIEEIAVS